MSVQNQFIAVVEARIVQLLDYGLCAVWLLPKGDSDSLYSMSNSLSISSKDWEIGLKKSNLLKIDGSLRCENWVNTFESVEIKFYNYRPLTAN